MGMKYVSDVNTSTNTVSDNIAIENVKIDSIEIKYGVQESWQTSTDDISLHMKLDIGKGFFPDFYIGGQFKLDDVSGNDYLKVLKMILQVKHSKDYLTSQLN